LNLVPVLGLFYRINRFFIVILLLITKFLIILIIFILESHD
jgi:hypothetical protein